MKEHESEKERPVTNLNPRIARKTVLGIALVLALTCVGGSPAMAGDKVIIAGDSWAALAGLVWNDTFIDNGRPDLTVQVEAFHGGLARDYADDPGLLAGIVAANTDAEWLIISLGGNDMMTDWQAGDESGWDQRLRNVYRVFLDPVIDARPDIKIVFVGYDFTNWQDTPECVLLALQVFRGVLITTLQINLEFLKISAAQLDMATEFSNVNTLGLWGTLQAAAGIPSAPDVSLPTPMEYMTDCIHANEAGYRIFTQAIYDAYFVPQFACTTDVDGDGFTDQACGGVDCNDADPSINPAAEEIPNNGIDDDCRASTPDDPPQSWGVAATAKVGASASLESAKWNGAVFLLLPLVALLLRKGVRKLPNRGRI